VIAALAPAGAAFLFGIALGERGELGAVQYIFLGVIPLAVAVMAWFAPRKRRLVLWIGCALIAGLITGQQAFARAYEDCRIAGPAVRDAIEAHARSKGEYPTRLTDLALAETPCSCLFRETILHYFHNDRGYRLWFTNDFEPVNFSGRLAV
jgi:hypothetical protein